MPEDRPIAVELEIAEARPLRGRLREQGGGWRPFSGWIGFAGAIDGVLPAGAGSPAPGGGPVRADEAPHGR